RKASPWTSSHVPGTTPYRSRARSSQGARTRLETTMTEPNPEAKPPEPAKAEPLSPQAPPRPRGPAPKPSFKSGPVPTISDEQAFGTPPKLRDLDAEIAGELEAAMAGFSEQELLTEEPRRAKDAAPAEPGRKKGKVMSIHGPDVFIDVPGGRSQGVLPLMQFPEGAPAIGAEVEVHIEGYDRANGLLLLSRKGAAVDADWSS